MSIENRLDEKIIVFQYTFIDDQENFQNVEEYFPNPNERQQILEKVETAFRKNGWEGDGKIGITWIPPFFYVPDPDVDPGQIYGTYIWHVKQHNNGISFLGFYPEGLNFISQGSLLALQNGRFFNGED
jgi:hypothetical protein